MNLFYNGNKWEKDELKMLLDYMEKVRIDHLVILLPRHCDFDIVRKMKELKEFKKEDVLKMIEEAD